jgi:hypothetical protein
MSSTQFAEWAAYYQLEPWGPERGDLRAGIVASVIANTHRDAKRKIEPFTPQDFMPNFDAQPVKMQPWQVLLDKARMITAAFGGEDLTHGG